MSEDKRLLPDTFEAGFFPLETFYYFSKRRDVHESYGTVQWESMYTPYPYTALAVLVIVEQFLASYSQEDRMMIMRPV